MAPAAAVRITRWGLFELATDGPGFASDEPPELVGERLGLPHWLKERGPEFKAALPPLDDAAD